MSIPNEGWSKWLKFPSELIKHMAMSALFWIITNNELHLFTLTVILSHLKPSSLHEACSEWGSLVLKATNHTSHTCYTNIIAFISVVCQMHNLFFFILYVLELIQFYCHSPFLIRTIHNWLDSNTFHCCFFLFIIRKNIQSIPFICSFIGNTFVSINASVQHRTLQYSNIIHYTSNIHIPSYQSFFFCFSF